MAIPDNANHHVISGVSAGVESFAFGFWLDDPTNSVDVANLDGTGPWDAFIASVLAVMAPDQHITAYDAYRYEGGVVAQHQHAAVDHAGLGGGGLLPLSVAAVITLRSATLSRRGRGRMYIPCGAFAVMGSSNHLFSGSQVNPIVDALADWFQALNTAGEVTPVVVSRVGSTMHPITSVDADLVPDVQRRRTAQQSTGRHTASV